MRCLPALGAAVIIVAALPAAGTRVSATTLILLQLKDELVLAADSLGQTIGTGSRASRGEYQTCKVAECGKFFCAASGPGVAGRDDLALLSPALIDAVGKAETIGKAAKTIQRTATGPFERTARAACERLPELVTMMGGKVFATYIIVGTRDGPPCALIVEFELDCAQRDQKARTWIVQRPQPTADDSFKIATGGWDEDALAFLNARGPKLLEAWVPLEDIATLAIRAQAAAAPQHVGGDVSIVRSDKAGLRWSVRAGPCTATPSSSP